LVGALGDEFRLFVDGVAQLLATLLHLAVLVEDAIHGPDRAMIEALVQQLGVDFRRGLVDEPRFAQQIEDGLTPAPWPDEGADGPGREGAGLSRSGDGSWRATDPAPRRPRRSARGRAAGPPRRPSGRLVAGHSSKATFFWISTIASARCKRNVTLL